jgi:hypothetical protein
VIFAAPAQTQSKPLLNAFAQLCQVDTSVSRSRIRNSKATMACAVAVAALLVAAAMGEPLTPVVSVMNEVHRTPGGGALEGVCEGEDCGDDGETPNTSTLPSTLTRSTPFFHAPALPGSPWYHVAIRAHARAHNTHVLMCTVYFTRASLCDDLLCRLAKNTYETHIFHVHSTSHLRTPTTSVATAQVW